MYRPESKTKVFCDPCWWADDWDGTEYGVDYDPGRNFFEQWRELRERTPHFAKDALYSSLKNCEYTNAIAFSKDCYLTFWADYCENVHYSSLLNTVKDSMDVFRAMKCESCYESVGIGMSSKVFFSDTCDDCVDVWFSRNCYGCMNCIGCANLRGQKYMIFNQQYTREEYMKKLEEFALDTRSGIKAIQKQAYDFWLSLPYREYTGNPRNLNVKGDYIFESKNAIDCYTCVGVEDSKYCEFVSVPKAENCMDYYGWGNAASMIYECAAAGEDIQGLKFSYAMFAGGMDSEYCGACIGSKNNFGCTNLKRKQYCILNKEYSKEEYYALRERIIEDMKAHPYTDSRGRTFSYGEFFPPEFSPYPFNDSNASRFIEKRKDEALAEGYDWQDVPDVRHDATLHGATLPETISQTQDSIVKEVIGCTICDRGYRVTESELGLYRKFNLPVPDQCPKCREKRRFDAINKPYSYDTVCTKCEKKITTMHDPKRGRIVYCESCYQKEIL